MCEAARSSLKLTRFLSEDRGASHLPGATAMRYGANIITPQYGRFQLEGRKSFVGHTDILSEFTVSGARCAGFFQHRPLYPGPRSAAGENTGDWCPWFDGSLFAPACGVGFESVRDRLSPNRCNVRCRCVGCDRLRHPGGGLAGVRGCLHQRLWLQPLGGSSLPEWLHPPRLALVQCSLMAISVHAPPPPRQRYRALSATALDVTALVCTAWYVFIVKMRPEDTGLVLLSCCATVAAAVLRNGSWFRLSTPGRGVAAVGLLILAMEVVIFLRS